MSTTPQTLHAGPLRLRLLGRFEIEGLEEKALGTRKGRALVRRLAAALGSPVPVDELVETLWGDDLPRHPHDQVSVLVSRVRGVLGAERVRRGDAGYWLDADWIDVVELEARTREVEERLRQGQVSSALAAAQAALALARGALLPEEDAPWVDESRASADRLLARARLSAAETALAVGDPATARAAAEAALDHDPYDEAALRLVMRADVLGGRPAAALAIHETFRERLSEDLGVDPGPETQALHLAVLRGQVPAEARGVLAAAPDLVGRAAELAALDAALDRARDGDAAAVVVEGDAGIGKSLLLRTWAARASASGAVVVSGSCDELGRALPLQPVVDGVASLLAAAGRKQAAHILGRDAALLAPLVGAPDAGDVAALVATVVDPDANRLALFGALAAALGRAAGSHPAVLVVDDLHLAAAGTAEFLAFALRRVPHILVVATRRPDPGPDLHRAQRLALGPLGIEEVAALVGGDRAAALHERSGGHPLFLVELARAAAAGEDELPRSIVEAVDARVVRLGGAAGSLRMAAVLGPVVDVDLLAAVTGRSVPELLDDLERGAAARLLVPRGTALAFAHELVRLAVEAATSPARRTAAHRAAAQHLALRADADPLAVAAHARLGEDPVRAAEALVRAAALAAERFEAQAAERLLDEAVALRDGAVARIARGRLRIARFDLARAKEDADRAIALGGGSHALELAGFVAYYLRDYEAARRYADEGVERAGDAAVRASCMALAGRIRHTRGELEDAASLLAEAVAVSPPAVRGLAQVWWGALLGHVGDTDAAVDMARRGVLEPNSPHPFGTLHGWFALAQAHGTAGRWAEALDAVDELEREAELRGDRRFPAIGANLRGWLMRGAGFLARAAELHIAAAEMPTAPMTLEPHYAALLDLCDDCLAAGDPAGAERALERCAGMLEWRGSMSWRHHERYKLAVARLALAGGDHTGASERAAGVAAAARDRPNRRYELRARLLGATADARAGRQVDVDALSAVVEEFAPLAGPDGWRDVGLLASAARCDPWFAAAERLAARVVEGARRRVDVDTDTVAAALRRELDALRR